MQRAAAKFYFFRQIEARRFRSSEVEWDHLADWLEPGDWCIDVGANIGRYTLEMSTLVGPTGHVIAFEPLTRSFELLTHFVEKGGYKNITLFNAAATERTGPVDITPDFSPLETAYIFDTNTRTALSKPRNSMSETKLGLDIDALNLQKRIKLIKVDVEGFEQAVCRGMAQLLQRDHPILIVEDHEDDATLSGFLAQFGYTGRRLSENGRNRVFMRS